MHPLLANVRNFSLAAISLVPLTALLFGCSGAVAAQHETTNSGRDGGGSRGEAGEDSGSPLAADAGFLGDGEAFVLQTLTTDQAPNDLAIDGPLLYLAISPESILTLPKAGGSPATLVTSDPSSPIEYQGLLLVAGSSLYWSDSGRGSSLGAASVVSAPLGGGSATLLSTVAGEWIGGLVVDGNAAYFIDQEGKTLRRTPTAGGSSTAVATLPDDAAGLILADGVFYFSDPSGDVYSLPESGGSPKKLVTGPGIPADTEYEDFPASIAVDSDAIYYSVCSNNGPDSMNLLRLPLAGGAPTALANSCARKLTIDATGIYWTDGNGVYAAPKAGGATVTLSSDPNITAGPVIDDQAVYWGISIDNTTCGLCPPPAPNQANTIMKVKKPSL